jgi:ABC-2 type transport system ATP-binding protein
MLEAIDLTKEFDGVKALDRLNLTVAAGEVFCLLGANGAGKTTTINLFLGFLDPTSGSVRVNGLDVTTRRTETRQLLAYIPEQVMLYPSLTGVENLAYFAALAGMDNYTDRELADFLEHAGLAREAAHRRLGTYSKGMRQKVGIAIAIAKGAEALLLDEPTSGLDPQASHEFSETLKRLRDEGVAVLMATHDLFRAKETGTRIGIMKRGQLLVTLGTSEIDHVDLEQLYIQHIGRG